MTPPADDGDSMITDSDSPPPSAPATASALPTPAGPICLYGPRLGFTFFTHPAPSPDSLNTATPPGLAATDDANLGGGAYWFTVDDQLLYLSFFMDSGPLNAACL